MELKLGPITRARMNILKASNRNEDNGMFEEFKGQEKTSKLFTICSINKDYSREQLECLNLKILNRGSSKDAILGRSRVQSYYKSGSISKWYQSNIQLMVNLSFIMSMEGQLPTQYHQEGTSDPTRMNLNETLRSIQQSIEGLVR
ncbi:hypothetical protein M9H77_02544 [Catharanthus roseus]|uniref:Uncharacterized protein n=1 Tax=Catharanthus roseus TaxID=4058 RepID=A0ACC0C8W1_CATRO|nr:hypothetical protein M9H77_02544 [Catharanthus roseus]